MLTASGAVLIAKNYSPSVVLPAIAVASAMVAILFGAQVLNRSRTRDARAPATSTA